MPLEYALTCGVVFLDFARVELAINNFIGLLLARALVVQIMVYDNEVVLPSGKGRRRDAIVGVHVLLHEQCCRYDNH